MRFLFFVLMLFLVSCSGFVNRIHEQIDRENGQGKFKKKDKFDIYRNPKTMAKNNSMSQKDINSDEVKNYHPSVKRQYLPQELIKKRYTAEDLVDNKPEGSLWVANDSNAFLFSEDNKKRSGDIVIINVKTELKNEITAALKRAFPDAPKKPKEGKEGEAADADKTKTAKAKEEPASGQGDEQVIDKISSVIIEEINRDHLLLRGRKTVLYKGSKKAVEIQALVARKDVSTEDAVESNNILETTVNVVR